MAQLATVLDTTNIVSAEGGLTYSTTVYPGATGIESRNSSWQTGRHAWSLTWIGTPEDLEPIFDLFEAALGMHKSFLWTPPGYPQMDFRFDADQMRISHQPGDPSLILTVTMPLIQVLDE